MAGTLMALIEIDCVPGQKPAHGGRQGGGFRSEQQVKVVVEKNPGITERPTLIEQADQVGKKSLSILIISENGPTFHSTCNDVLQQAGMIDAGSAGHVRFYPQFNYSSPWISPSRYFLM
jgi:hypothetical protein